MVKLWLSNVEDLLVNWRFRVVVNLEQRRTFDEFFLIARSWTAAKVIWGFEPRCLHFEVEHSTARFTASALEGTTLFSEHCSTMHCWTQPSFNKRTLKEWLRQCVAILSCQPIAKIKVGNWDLWQKKSISRNVLFRSKCQERLRITAWQTNLGTWKNSRLN